MRALPVFCFLALLLLFAQNTRAEAIPFEEGDSIEVIREKIRLNGYDFTVAPQNIPARKRGSLRSPDPQAELFFKAVTPRDFPLPIPENLPEAYDSRDVEGVSYIGPVRDQGNCGNCYAFGSTAAAEASYNRALDLYDDETADFSESFVTWCLGEYGPYREYFHGCEGGDNEFATLESFIRTGLILESDFPYTDVDPGSCQHWGHTRTRFRSWARCDCSNIQQIKTAIMQHGAVAAMVMTSRAFELYAGGVYEDSLNGCPGEECEEVDVDHLVALVGWNDNGDPEEEGYWILRNSWGSDWGEGGYMRIKYDSARVSCATAFITYSTQGVPAAGPFQLALMFLALASLGLVARAWTRSGQ